MKKNLKGNINEDVKKRKERKKGKEKERDRNINKKTSSVVKCNINISNRFTPL